MSRIRKAMEFLRRNVAVVGAAAFGAGRLSRRESSATKTTATADHDAKLDERQPEWGVTSAADETADDPDAEASGDVGGPGRTPVPESPADLPRDAVDIDSDRDSIARRPRPEVQQSEDSPQRAVRNEPTDTPPSSEAPPPTAGAPEATRSEPELESPTPDDGGPLARSAPEVDPEPVDQLEAPEPIDPPPTPTPPDGAPEVPAEHERPVMTTKAIGEEGDEKPEPPKVTTMAMGEEGDEGPGIAPEPPTATTLAVGEEGDDGTIEPIAPPDVTTKMTGEEGDEPSEPPTATTMALGEEGDEGPGVDPIEAPEPPKVTTMMVGEEGDERPGFGPIGPPEVTTKMVGEEGDEKPEPPKVTTMAIGEEGDDPLRIDPEFPEHVDGPGWDPGPVDDSTDTDVDLGFGAGSAEPVEDVESDPMLSEIEEPLPIESEPASLDLVDEPVVADLPPAQKVDDVLVDEHDIDDDDPVEP